MSLEGRVAAEVRALSELGLEDLRSQWKLRWDDVPAVRSPEILRHMLAWRIQVAALGGLDSFTRRALRQQTVAGPALRLTPGVRLAREWKGERHDVEVVDGGFRHHGVTYKSLSKVASVIAGSKWNGLRFFGLKDLAA